MEEEARQRKERIERWRREKEKEEEASMSKVDGNVDGANENELTSSAAENAGWSLENDDDDDDDDADAMDDVEITNQATANNNAMDEDDELDPLDAFMAGVTAEVRKTLKTDSSSSKQKSSVKSKAAEDAPVKEKEVAQLKEREDEEEMENAENPQPEEDDFDLNDASNLLALAMKKAKRKDVIAVDHEAIKYIEFRKNFYQETQEISKMTPEQTLALRKDLDGIRIRGKNCPKPITKWTQCGLNVKILDILIKKCKYEKPTSIQCQAIPAIMSGRDVIAVAKTGSGKTMAFILPMLRHVLDQPPLGITDGPIALIMTPTRELAVQIFLECRKLTKALNLRVRQCIYFIQNLV